MFKKLVSMILMVSVISSAMVMLSGCGKDKQSGAAGTFDADGNYVPTEDLNVTVWYTQGTDFVAGSKLEKNVVEEYVYDKTKVIVDNIYGNDGGQWDTKLSRLIAGDNMPEIVACGASQGPTHFARLKQADKVWGITKEMLEKYAPNVLKRVPEKVLEKFEIDGKYYGIPYGLRSFKETQPGMSEELLNEIKVKVEKLPSDQHMQIYIRDDILKKIYPEAKDYDEIEKLFADTNDMMGDELFDIPIKTTEEYIDFMRKIKDLGMTTAAGDPVFAFGYSGGDNWEALTLLGSQMMGYETLPYTGVWNHDTQSVIIPLTTEIVKQAAKNQNQLINEKVIDPESLVHTPEMFTQNVLKGQYAMAVLSYAGGPESVNASLAKENASFRYRPFVVQIPRAEGYTAVTRKSDYSFDSSLCFTKTLNEDGLIQMLNWMNTFYSDEFEEVFWWGREEDGLYTEDENGKRRYVDERFNDRFLNNNTASLPDAETMGIGVTSSKIGTWHCNPIKIEQSAWNPKVYNGEIKLSVAQKCGFGVDSEHTKHVEYGPSGDPWDASYAKIDEVVTFWAKREQWEGPVKVAISSPEAQFETKWQEAMDNLNKIVDVKEMTKKMTEAALANF